MTLWETFFHFNHLIAILKVVFLVIEQFWQTVVTCTRRLACVYGKQMMISQKMENIKIMYTPIYLFAEFAFFFLQTIFLCVGENHVGRLGFGGERRGAAGQAGESGVALRTRGGKSWRYSEKINREIIMGNAMDCAHVHAGKGEFCNEKIPPERLNQEES